MFDGDEIKAMTLLLTNGEEVYAVSVELVENNLFEVTSATRKIERHQTVNHVLDMPMFQK